MIHVALLPYAGIFAENKDRAREIRKTILIPALQKGEQEVILDFSGIEDATQSFIHALISDLIRIYSSDVLRRIQFKSCSPTVKQIISIVTDYMQEGEDAVDEFEPRVSMAETIRKTP